MMDFSQRIASLSPEKRALLERRLTQKNGPPAKELPISLRAQRDLAPLSFAQQRLWFLDQLEPGSTTYNVSNAVRLKGPLNIDALNQTMTEIVRRHEILRTVFRTSDGAPVQVILPAEPQSLTIVDLEELPESKREAEAQRLIAEGDQIPFDLANGPLLRARLLRLSKDEHIVALALHHIISDAWSLGILIREVAVLYEAFSLGRPSPLAELPIQYGDYANWQREWLQGNVLETQMAYWRRQLADAPAALDLPTDWQRPAVQTFNGAHCPFRPPRDLAEALKELSRQEGVTLFMTVLTAFKTLLHRYTGQSEICIGSPIANRGRVETEGVIGFFLNTLVLRSDFSDNPTFRELLSRVKEIALEAYANQDVPFERLVEELQVERDLSRQPLFQVMFTMQTASSTTFELSGLHVSTFDIEGTSAKFDLTVNLEEGSEEISGVLEYNTDLFERETIERLATHFEQLLWSIVSNPEQRVSELALLAERERRQLLQEWNETRAEYPAAQCLHQLFV